MKLADGMVKPAPYQKLVEHDAVKGVGRLVSFISSVGLRTLGDRSQSCRPLRQPLSVEQAE